MQSVCVFCGSSAGNKPAYRDAATVLGRLLAERGLCLVYGGGRTGLMGAVADSVLQAGGKVVGVMPRSLVDKEVAHRALTAFEVVETMHERKARMAELSDGFVAMPGGFGTLDEFCEILTWAQLQFHRKPCGLWNVEGYFDPLLALFDHGVREDFIKPMHRELVIADTVADRLLDRMAVHLPAAGDKW